MLRSVWPVALARPLRGHPYWGEVCLSGHGVTLCGRFRCEYHTTAGPNGKMIGRS
jgi:hypothetical protein